MRDAKLYKEQPERARRSRLKWHRHPADDFHNHGLETRATIGREGRVLAASIFMNSKERWRGAIAGARGARPPRSEWRAQ